MTEEFSNRLERELDLFLTEMADGCVNCIEIRQKKGNERAFFEAHDKVAMDAILYPRKYLKLKKGSP